MTRSQSRAGDPERVEAGFVDYLESSGLKITVPRRIILSASLRMNTAFNAEELHAEAKQQDGQLSLASVYRTLPILTQAGVLRLVDSRDKKQYFEVNRSDGIHIQVHCTECKKSFEIDDESLRIRQFLLLREMGLNDTAATVVISARCESHQEAESNES